MLKLTSVKLLDNLYKKFKISNLDDNFTLQKLINRSMDLYVNDNDFRSRINEYKNLKPSGSALWEKAYWLPVSFTLKLL